MKQVYIHIGLHKTGSTYIQKVFADNRTVLQEAGIEYPKLGAEFLYGHHNIAWSLIPGHVLENTDDFTFDKLLTHLSASLSKRFLISSEDFEFFQTVQIDKLHHLLSDYDTKIVMYIRDPVDALYSRWQESVKHGDTTSLEAYYRQILASPSPLDYYRGGDRWAAIFGQQAMRFVIYDNLVANKIDIALYFITEVLKVKIERKQLLMPEKRINPASNIGVIEVLRQLNHIQKALGHPEKLTDAFMKFIRRHPHGQALTQYLQTESIQSTSFIDLMPLDEVFSQIAEGFLKTYGKQIMNTYSTQQVFGSRRKDDLKVPVINSQALAQKIDIATLHEMLSGANILLKDKVFNR